MATRTNSAMDDMDKFLRLLNRISKLASDEHLKTAKFLLKEKLTRKQVEKCEDMKDIFDKLITKGLIAPNDTYVLRELVEEIFSDIRITQMVDHYETMKLEVLTSKTADNHSTPQKQCITAEGRANTDFPAVDASSKISRLSSKRITVTMPGRFQEQFGYASTLLGSDWKVLARLIGMAEQDITHLDTDCGDDAKRAYRVMKIWFVKQEKASSKQFRKLLRLIPRNDIADDLQEMSCKNAASGQN